MGIMHTDTVSLPQHICRELPELSETDDAEVFHDLRRLSVVARQVHPLLGVRRYGLSALIALCTRASASARGRPGGISAPMR